MKGTTASRSTTRPKPLHQRCPKGEPPDCRHRHEHGLQLLWLRSLASRRRHCLGSNVEPLTSTSGASPT